MAQAGQAIPGVLPGSTPSSHTVPGTTSSYQGGIGPEALASTDIAGLLNPPALFPDTSRQAAEVAAGRGIAGSGAAGQTATRMTEEERLKHIALGNQLLDSQTGRQSTLGITPIQQAQLNLQQQQADLARKYQEFYIQRLSTPNITYSGGLGPHGGGALPVSPPPAYSNMASFGGGITPTAPPNVSRGGGGYASPKDLPLYPGQPGSYDATGTFNPGGGPYEGANQGSGEGGQLDAVLRELGLPVGGWDQGEEISLSD